MNSINENNYAVIMAGGVGSRFWPVSTASFPKQFQDIMGVGETLLQLTYNRLASLVLRENILILTNQSYKKLVQEQLPKIKDEQIILEPAMCNTAPCILLSALKIRNQNPNAVMLVAPSDHWIQEKEAFQEDIAKAFDAASKDILITLGIQPTFANTGYGYIKFEKQDKDLQDKEPVKVENFTEKPTLRNAKKYLEDGNYLWNAGIFVWKASVIIDAFEEHMSDMFKLFEGAKDKLNTKEEDNYINEVYPKAQNISIDYAILEKSEKVYVIPASFSWDDLGTWGALYSKLAKDKLNNAVVNAHLVPREAKNNMVYTKSQKTVFIDGLEDFIVVDEDDVLLIIPKAKEQDIKQIRAEAMEKFGDHIG